MRDNKDVIIITGGLGYIGSHIALAALSGGYKVVLVDSLVNSRIETLGGVRSAVEINTKSRLDQDDIRFKAFDVRDVRQLYNLIRETSPLAIIHCAGLKDATESMLDPLGYRSCNVGGMESVLAATEGSSVRAIIFSSSAAVYGNVAEVPVSEYSATCPLNPYAQSKVDAEEALIKAKQPFSRVVLRYFNPTGGARGGFLGDLGIGRPSNLFPQIMLSHSNRQDRLKIYRASGSTPDGTGLRDFIHVCDLADAHVEAIKFALAKGGAVDTFNLGTGVPVSTMQVVKEFSKQLGSDIRYELCDSREHEIAISYASPLKANTILNWKATRGLSDMVSTYIEYFNKHGQQFYE